jgi:N6-L-threonylcarbamoyladenine synthase
MLVLGIETSCDETAAAVVQDRRKILSNVILSQNVHEIYGGVVPELASREHLKTIIPTVERALEVSGCKAESLDGIAVTYGPGLVGSLLIGLCFAKGMAYSYGKPLIGVNHLEGHLFSNYLEHPDLVPPFVCLIISGGHTLLVHVSQHGKYRLLGETRDDAAGEAFDKVGFLVDLGYPAGPKLDQLAQAGNPEAIRFPRAYLEKDSFDFSLSGIKTAVALHWGRLTDSQREQNRADVAASFQEAVVDVLVDKLVKATVNLKTERMVLAGGVACNSRLRQRLREKEERLGLGLYYPSPNLCTDNGAMIAAVGDFKLSQDQGQAMKLNAVPYLRLESTI